MTEQQPAAAPARRRGRETAGDMVRSLLVVLVLVAVVVALRGGDGSERETRPLDYSGTLTSVRDRASYDVLAPIGLPDTWVPTSARGGRDGDAVTWHLGFVTPAGDYAGLEQSDGDPEAVVDSVAEGGDGAGSTRIGGVTWERVEGGSPEQRALVLQGEDVTTVVAGGASWAELRELARSLQAG